MKTNSKIKTYQTYNEIPKADKNVAAESANAPYEFLKHYYRLVS